MSVKFGREAVALDGDAIRLGDLERDAKFRKTHFHVSIVRTSRCEGKRTAAQYNCWRTLISGRGM